MPFSGYSGIEYPYIVLCWGTEWIVFQDDVALALS